MAILRFYWTMLFLLAALGVGIALTGKLWGLILVALAVLALRGFKEIPADPPHVGILTIYGRRMSKIFKEGLILLADFFPIFFGVILIDVQKKNIDFVFEKVRCKLGEDPSQTPKDGSENEVIREPESGGSVSIHVSVTIEPNQRDPKRLISYLNSGPVEKDKDTGEIIKVGVVAIIEDMLGEDTRQMGKGRTWLDIEFGQDELSARLITKMTGKKICHVKREEGDESIPVTDSDGKFVLEELSPKAKLDALDCAYFLQKSLENGTPDIHDLGTLISRLNIKRVVPEGALAENAELAALEVLQRRAEGMHFDTEIYLARKYQDARGGRRVSLEKALEWVRLNRNKENAQEIFVRSGGNPFDAIIAALATSKQPNQGTNGGVVS